jgi:hypothetical protein
LPLSLSTSISEGINVPIPLMPNGHTVPGAHSVYKTVLVVEAGEKLEGHI